jgi:hypothetical protein
VDNKFTNGQRVRFIKITGSHPGIDREINQQAGKTGTVVNYYCVTRDEMPDLIKMVVYPDVFSYDICLDDNGAMVRGIPEAALEPE